MSANVADITGRAQTVVDRYPRVTRVGRLAKALTARAVESAQAGAARREIPDGLLTGLYLVVQPNGGKSWAVRYRALGRPRKLTLGRWPAIQLGTARELARKALREVAEGHDPASDKRASAQPAGDLVEQVAAAFIDRHIKPNTRPSTAREMSRLLNVNIIPLWRGRRLQDIETKDVVELLDRMSDRGAAVSANRTLAVARRMFRWAMERGVIERSPCERVRAPATERARDRVLRDNEIQALWRACDRVGWPFGPLVQLLLLTGQRRDEVAEMRWEEIDLGAKIWTLPRRRVKNDREHQVPLSGPALAILKSLPRLAVSSGRVFSTNGRTAVSGFSRAKRRLDAAMADAMAGLSPELEQGSSYIPGWRIHDLRRTAATGMARLGINLPVIEKVLNHTSGSFAGVVGIYQRHSFAEEKRAALEQWGGFVKTLQRMSATAVA